MSLTTLIYLTLLLRSFFLKDILNKVTQDLNHVKLVHNRNHKSSHSHFTTAVVKLPMNLQPLFHYKKTFLFLSFQEKCFLLKNMRDVSCNR